MPGLKPAPKEKDKSERARDSSAGAALELGPGNTRSGLPLFLQSGSARTPLRSAGGSNAVAASPSATPMAAAQAMQSTGAELEGQARESFQARFGADLEAVRIHRGKAVNAAAHVLRARAFTVGNHIAWPDAAPDVESAAGQALLTHELVHVVQQGRGQGSGASASSVAAEQEATAGSSMAGSGRIPVRMATVTGTAASREEWLQGTPDLSHRGFTELLDDSDQIAEWLARQTTSSSESTRMEEALAELRQEVARRQRASAGPPATRKARGKPAAAPSPVPDTPMPRVLAERSSIVYRDASEMRTEVDRIMAWLARGDLSRGDRNILKLELANLSPQLQQDRAESARKRRAEVVASALAGSGDERQKTLESLRKIDSIRPLAGQPGVSYLMHGSEIILLSDQEVEAQRASILKALDKAADQIHSMNEMTLARGQDHMDLNYKEHPYVGFAVSLVSGEEPVELWDRMLTPIQKSNMAAGQYRIMRKREQGSLEEKGRQILDAAEEAGNARQILEEGIGRAMSAAGSIVTALEITKTVAFTVALSIAAILAAPVVAAGVAGLGATGVVAGGLTIAGTATVTGGAGVVLGGGSTALAGGNWQEIKGSAAQWGKQGVAIGAGAGTTTVLSGALSVGAPGLSTASNIARSTLAQAGGNVVGSTTGTALMGGSLSDVAKSGGVALGTSLVTGPLGYGANTLGSPALKTAANMAVGGGAGFASTYALTGDTRQALLSAGVGAGTSGVLSMASTSQGMTPGQRWAYQTGRSARAGTRNLLAAGAIWLSPGAPVTRGMGATVTIPQMAELPTPAQAPASSMGKSGGPIPFYTATGSRAQLWHGNLLEAPQSTGPVILYDPSDQPMSVLGGRAEPLRSTPQLVDPSGRPVGPTIVDLQAGRPNFLQNMVGGAPGSRGIGVEAGDWLIGYQGIHPTDARDLRVARQLVQEAPHWPDTPAWRTPFSELPQLEPWQIDPSNLLFPREGPVVMLREPFFNAVGGPSGPAPGSPPRLIPHDIRDVTSISPTTHPELAGAADQIYIRRPFGLSLAGPSGTEALGREINNMLRPGGFVEFRLRAAVEFNPADQLDSVARQIPGARIVRVNQAAIDRFVETGALPPDPEQAAILQNAEPDLRGQFGALGAGTPNRIIRIYKSILSVP